MTLIDEKGSATTRRSAGIPALITAVCNAEPAFPSTSSVVRDLMAIANQTPPVASVSHSVIHLPQVHAMNSLNSLFMQSKLAERLEASVVPVMATAAQGLTSQM